MTQIIRIFALLTLTITLTGTVACQKNQAEEPNHCGVVTPGDSTADALVIGDSISMAYTPYLNFNVESTFHTACNSRDTATGLANMKAWMAYRPRYKLITINHGIWDIHFGRPVEAYVANLRTEMATVLAHADHVVFLTTTEGNYHSVPPVKVREFNTAAVTLMNELGVTVLDLHAVSLQNKTELQPDLLHYTAEGSRVFGEAINQFVALIIP